MQHTHDTRTVSVDQIKKVFEAGFFAAAKHCDMGEEEARRIIQHEWKKFCGINT